MSVNVADILAAPARIYYAPVGAAIPSETTIAYDQAWGGSWVSLGSTLTPVTFAYNQELFDIEVESSTIAVKRGRSKEEATIETTLAESLGVNLGLAFDGAVTTTAAGASQKGFTEVNAGGKLLVSEYAFGIESLYVNSAGVQFPVRLFVWKANAMLNGNLEFSKKAATGIPLQIKALADVSKPIGQRLLKFQKVTANATS
jgi:hypothetical protein